MIKISMFIFVLVFLQLVTNGFSQRTKNKMYEKIPGVMCYRRLNATHQIGCSSKWGGSTGVIHFCEKQEDLEFILNNGTAGPYVPIIPTRMFSTANVNKMNASQKISGLILHTNNNELLESFTHEKQCPNDRYNLEGTCQNSWNPFGTGMLYMDIPFPMFLVEDSSQVEKIRNCFQKFNNFSYETQKDRSLCSVELNSFMYAATNTEVCQRRSNLIMNLNPVKFCDPLGDFNVWGALFSLVTGPKNDTKPVRDYKYIVIASRLDTTSLFTDTAGANSPITSMVTLLSIAKLLKTMLPSNVENYKKNVLFVLFNGETYDYIGSQRFLYDMERGVFPVDLDDDNDRLPIIRPENVSLFVEISQMGNSIGNVYAHYLNDSTEIMEFFKKLMHHSSNLNFNSQPNSLPPSSVHTFLKSDQVAPHFNAILLADHGKEYSNKYFNSLYDNARNIRYQYYNVSTEDASEIPKNSIQYHIVNVARMVARSVFEDITNKSYDGSDNVDVGLVDELIHCYLEDPSCRVFRAIQKDVRVPRSLFSLYVGVDGHSNPVTSLTALTLAWFTGDIVGESIRNCTNRPRHHAYRFYNMSESIYDLNVTKCYRATINTTEAMSPAFLIEDYDWSSGRYSTWAESTWSEISLRLFLRPSKAHETMTIAIGLITTIFSFIIVYFIHSRSHILFRPAMASAEEVSTHC